MFRESAVEGFEGAESGCEIEEKVEKKLEHPLERFEKGISEWQNRMEDIKTMIGPTWEPPGKGRGLGKVRKSKCLFFLNHDVLVERIITMYLEMNKLIKDKNTEFDFFKGEMSKLKKKDISFISQKLASTEHALS